MHRRRPDLLRGNKLRQSCFSYSLWEAAQAKLHLVYTAPTSGKLTCVCADSAHSAVHLQLTLKRMDQTAALTQLLLEDAQLMLEPVNTRDVVSLCHIQLSDRCEDAHL